MNFYNFELVVKQNNKAILDELQSNCLKSFFFCQYINPNYFDAWVFFLGYMLTTFLP